MRVLAQPRFRPLCAALAPHHTSQASASEGYAISAANETASQQSADSAQDNVQRAAPTAAQQHSSPIAALKHVAWKAIHTGPWHAVPVFSRGVYGLAALLSAMLQAASGEPAACGSAAVRNEGAPTAPDFAALLSRSSNQSNENRSAPDACAVGEAQMSSAKRARPESGTDMTSQNSMQQQGCADICDCAACQRTGHKVPAAAQQLDVALLLAGPALRPFLHCALAILLPPLPQLPSPAVPATQAAHSCAHDAPHAHTSKAAALAEAASGADPLAPH